MELIDPVVVAGDLGFAKRARNFADMIGASVAFVEKRRLGNDSRSESLGVIGDVRGKSAIVIDDEIDTAGSIVGAAEIVRQAGARVVLRGVHPRAADRAGRRAAEELADPGDHRHRYGRAAASKRMPNMTVLSVALLLGEAISRIHTGESVGALFGAPV